MKNIRCRIFLKTLFLVSRKGGQLIYLIERLIFTGWGETDKMDFGDEQ
jgi:hypothetical protein